MDFQADNRFVFTRFAHTILPRQSTRVQLSGLPFSRQRYLLVIFNE